MKLACMVVLCALLLGCTPEQDRLEAEREVTSEQLETLPRLKIDTLTPTLGYLSKVGLEQRAGDQITITFRKPKPADTIVLIPANFLNNKNVYAPRGFPLRFKIEAQTAKGKTILIADHTQADFPSPGIAPVIFKNDDPRSLKSLRLTVTKPSQGGVWFTPGPIVMFNELLVFSGEENIALNAEVHTDIPFNSPWVFDPDFLVDGYTHFLPYEPLEPILSKPYSQFRSHVETVEVSFDLGGTHTVDEARFYPNNFNPQVANPHSAGIGFPAEILLQISESPSIETVQPGDTRVILEPGQLAYACDAPLYKKIEPIQGRYVHITLKEGRKDPRHPVGKVPMISLSEIELLHNGVNLLAGIPFQTPTPLDTRDQRKIRSSVLTDGEATIGRIVQPKEWFLKLSKRAELEQKNAALGLAQEQNYALQKALVRNLLFAIPIILLVSGIVLLRNRYQHRKKTQALRERIADDLHDEMGATLSSIANSAQLLAELSSETNSDDEAELIGDIIESAERSAKETRALILFLEKDSTQGNLIERFEHTARQMLAGFELSLDLQAEKQFNQLIPIQKWDLLLFYKEVLNNIIKHADADRVEICTRKSGRALYLEIHDNGKGLPPNARPTHLLKRGKKLNAKIEVIAPQSGGTTVTCTLPSR